MTVELEDISSVDGNTRQIAVVSRNMQVVSFLLEKGANLNARGGFYSNALHAAVAQENNLRIVLLLENGANTNARGGFYGNTLHLLWET